MHPNPYDPPAASGVEPSVDRAARTAVAEQIRRFLDERTSAFQFDEALDPFQASSDPTVRFVARTVWFHYDDCQDHFVTLAKPEWDYFQRLLLLLESDQQIELVSVRRWSWTQLLALGCLAGFGWCVWRFGWGQHLLAFSIPFGIVSMIIAWLRARIRFRGAYDQILAPFATFAELSTAYRTAAGFAKKRYPHGLAKRRIRSRVAEFGLRLQWYALWLMLSPIPLLVQTLPVSETRTRVKPAARSQVCRSNFIFAADEVGKPEEGHSPQK
jgi:hypothetical protein